MPTWISNLEAPYVFAAYGMAAALLLGLLWVSLRGYFRAKAAAPARAKDNP